MRDIQVVLTEKQKELETVRAQVLALQLAINLCLEPEAAAAVAAAQPRVWPSDAVPAPITVPVNSWP